MAPVAIPPVERFFARVEMHTEPDGCDIWTGSTTQAGYGLFALSHSKSVLAHRWWYEFCRGPISAPQLDHLCRNPRCIRLEHLEPVTARVNTLRGIGPTARNAKKTHCPKGHPYDIAVRGGRWCRRCKYEAWKRWDSKRKAGAS